MMEIENLFLICISVVIVLVVGCISGCNMYNSKKFVEGHYCSSIIKPDSSIWVKCEEK